MAKSKEKVTPERGDIYLINFDPAIGAEIRKTRPALVLQNDIANRFSPITIVAAITSRVNEPLYPTEVLIGGKEIGLTHDSVVLLNQIRSIDKKRLVKYLGAVGKETMNKVDHALEISLGMAEI